MSQSPESIFAYFRNFHQRSMTSYPKTNFPPRTTASNRICVATAFLFIVTLFLFSTDFFRDKHSVEETMDRLETLINVSQITHDTNPEKMKAQNSASKTTHTSRALKAADSIPSYYTELENEITESSVVWADFLMIPRERLRSKQVTLEAKVLNTMKLCSPGIVANLSAELAGADLNWCKWTLSATGGKVKVGYLSLLCCSFLIRISSLIGRRNYQKSHPG